MKNGQLKHRFDKLCREIDEIHGELKAGKETLGVHLKKGLSGTKAKRFVLVEMGKADRRITRLGEIEKELRRVAAHIGERF